MSLEELDWGDFARDHAGEIREVWDLEELVSVELFRSLQEACRQFIHDTSDPRWENPKVEQALIKLDGAFKNLIELSADDLRATSEYISFLPEDPEEGRTSLKHMRAELRRTPMIWPGSGVHRNDTGVRGRRAMLLLADRWFELTSTKPKAGLGRRNSQGFYKFAIQHVGSLEYSSDELTRYSFFVLNGYAKVVRNWKPPSDRTP